MCACILRLKKKLRHRPQEYQSLTLRQSLSLAWSTLVRLDQLASEPQESYLPNATITRSYTIPSFLYGYRDQTQVLMLVRQVLH